MYQRTHCHIEEQRCCGCKFTLTSLPEDKRHSNEVRKYHK